MVDDNRPNPSHTPLKPNNLTFAISVALAAPASVAMAQDQDQDAAGDLTLEEVLVTARKRAESAMDIPESIQAITSDTIQVAGLTGIDDYARFIPSLSYVSSNPGSANIYFRGVADAATTFIAEASAALYLDEQSLTLNATPNPRMVDIERIEALSGPQGTLYGANAQSGLLRIITNKPDPTAFDAFVDLTYKGGSDVDDGYDVSAMGNFPISDSFALRLVGFTAKDGGFIDNINGDSVPNGIFNNAGSEREDFNDVKYKGGRVSARWFMNDDWTMTAGIIYQDTKSGGRPELDPTQDRDLAVSRFKIDHEFDDTEWSQYSLTFEGDLGFADFVSATSYFTRDWVYQQDTQTYASYFGTFCYAPYFYYAPYCFFPAGEAEFDPVYSYYIINNDPIGYLQNDQKDTKFAQEFRLTHQGDRFDWVAGLFYEKAEQDWIFDTFTDNYEQSQGYANWLAGRLGEYNPTAPPEGAWWRSGDSTTWTQYAIFGEFTWHINDSWDATFGGRWFDRDQEKYYFVENPRGNTVTELNLPASDSDFVPKVSLSWRVNDDVLLYALYSEGFRPGGTNRNRSLDTFFPRQYDADYLKNFEIGTKMTLADGRVRLTATYFDMQWEDYQLEIIDPSNRPCDNPNALPPPLCGQPWQKVVGNVGDASSSGLEIQLDARVTDGLSAGFNATWVDAKLDDGFTFLVETPAGSRLPLTPEFKAAAYGQYDWDVNWFSGSANNFYMRLQWSYTGDMLNQVEPFRLSASGECCDFSDPNYGPAPQLLQPSYNIGDFKTGVQGDTWSLQFFVNNLTDERAILFDNPFEFDHYFGKGRQTINRPREYGLRYIKRFQ